LSLAYAAHVFSLLGRSALNGNGDGNVFWAGLAIVVIGLLVGACFRVSALVAVSAALVIVSTMLGLLAGHSIGSVVFPTLVLLLILQCAYLLGLALAMILSRMRGRGVL
jgi:hypothetical protein